MTRPFNSMGLGTDYRIDCSTGLTIDCDAFSNFFNQTCWGLCSAQSLPAGVVVGGAPAAMQTCDLSFFSETSCLSLGSFTIGNMTALAIGAVIAAIFIFRGTLFGGRR